MDESNEVSKEFDELSNLVNHISSLHVTTCEKSSSDSTALIGNNHNIRDSRNLYILNNKLVTLFMISPNDEFLRISAESENAATKGSSSNDDQPKDPIEDLLKALTKAQLDILESYFIKNPTPSKSTKYVIAKKLEISHTKVENWFTWRYEQEISNKVKNTQNLDILSECDPGEYLFDEHRSNSDFHVKGAVRRNTHGLCTDYYEESGEMQGDNSRFHLGDGGIINSPCTVSVSDMSTNNNHQHCRQPDQNDSMSNLEFAQCCSDLSIVNENAPNVTLTLPPEPIADVVHSECNNLLMTESGNHRPDNTLEYYRIVDEISDIMMKVNDEEKLSDLNSEEELYKFLQEISDGYLTEDGHIHDNFQ